MSLPKDLYPLAKDVSIPSKWLFGDDINARINNIKAQQNAFKVDKTHLKSERIFYGLAYFSKQDSKNLERFPESPEINTKGTKTIVEKRHTRKQGTSWESKYKET